MNNDDLSSWVCTALMRIGTRMATEFDHRFADLGITQSQFRVLLAVYALGGVQGITPSVLADRLFIERGTVSVISNRMVERGWLIRQTGENRRSFRLALTQEGAALLHKATPRAAALANHTLAQIPPQELAEMRANLERVEMALREYVPSKELK